MASSMHLWYPVISLMDHMCRDCSIPRSVYNRGLSAGESPVVCMGTFTGGCDCGVNLGFRWDQIGNSYICKGCGKKANQQDAADALKSSWSAFPAKKVCQCGAEKTHGESTGHSTWCDKYAK